MQILVHAFEGFTGNKDWEPEARVNMWDAMQSA